MCSYVHVIARRAAETRRFTTNQSNGPNIMHALVDRCVILFIFYAKCYGRISREGMYKLTFFLPLIIYEWTGVEICVAI